MTKSSKRQDSVRAPVQQRSQQRVEQILDACKALILKRGCAALKMSDIATTAEISVGSIYQYFPNKQAIVAALATHYLDVFRVHAFNVLKEAPNNLDALWQGSMQVIDDYYRLHREDPVVRDIWMGFATDKTLRSVAEQDNAKYLEFYFERSKHLFKPSQHERVKHAFALISDFARIAVDRSVELDELEGDKNMEIAKELLSFSWEGTIKPLARAAKKRN